MQDVFNLRDAHRERSALVMGSGPSLRQLDGVPRVPHVTIAVNAAILTVPEPDYWCTADYWGALKMEYWGGVLRSRCRVVLSQEHRVDVRTQLAEFDDPARVYWYRKRPDTSERSLRAAKADDGRLLVGLCSAHAAVHLAVMLGCSPVFLIGCDLRYEAGNKYAWEFDERLRGFHAADGRSRSSYIYGERARGRDIGDRDYSPEANGTSDGDLGAFGAEWRLIVDANPDIDIRDASGGGLTGVVKQVAVAEVLGE